MKTNSTEMMNSIKSLLLNSVLSKSQIIYKTFVKAFQLGAQINTKITLDNFNDKLMGFGYRSMQDINKNQEIMRIPVSIGIHGKDLKYFTDDEHKKIVREMCDKSAQYFHQNKNISYMKLFQTQILTMQVLLNLYNEKAELNDFVYSFPMQDLTSINFWNQKTFETISSRNLKTLVIDNRNIQEILYSFVTEKSIYDIKKEDYFWAFNNVNARKITIMDNPQYSFEEIQREMEKPSNKFDPNMDYSNKIYQMILPIFDYFNHSFEPNCRFEPFYDEDEKKSYLICLSEREIKQNDQLLVNYGNESNITFLIKYGFCLRDNPNHETFLSFFEQFDEENNNEFSLKFINTAQENFIHNDLINSDIDFKMKIFQKMNIDIADVFNFNLRLFPNKLDSKILKILRVLLINHEENLDKNASYNHDFSKMYSVSNENFVHRYLYNNLNFHYKAISDKNYDKKIEDIGTINSKEKIDLMNLYIIENEEQSLLQKNIKFLKSRLEQIHNNIN